MNPRALARSKSLYSSLLFLGDWYINELIDASQIIGKLPFVFNLEAPISSRGVPTAGKINLRMEKNRILECFGRKPAGICLANNHIADYGDEALQDTFEVLKAMDVPFFGAGNDEDNYNNPAVIEVGSSRVAMLGYVCPSTNPIYSTNERLGVAPLDTDLIRADMQYATECGAHRLVVMLHWGFQDTLLPRPDDVQKAHTIIDYGADLIVGHHAHSPQPVEVYQGKTIAYGLGNFIFPDLEIPLYEKSSNKEPTRVYKQRQRYWNKVSWGLVWDASDNSWKTDQYFFDGEQVIFKRFLNPCIRGANVNSLFYPLRFRIHLSMHRFLWSALDYVRNPSRLRPRHLLSALRILIKPSRS